MKKEYIIGGLAIVGGLSLLAYFTSKPRRNSEGFFNARGQGLGNTDGLPFTFRRKPSLLNPCYVFSKRITPFGQIDYSTKPLGASEELTSGITYQDFKNAYYNLPKCKS